MYNDLLQHPASSKENRNTKSTRCTKSFALLVLFVLFVFLPSAVSSKLQMYLAREGSESGLRLDFSEGPGIHVQIRIRRGRMIQDVLCIDAQRQRTGFREPDPLLKVRIQAPASRTVNRVQSQSSKLSGRRILKDDVAAGIGDGSVLTERIQSSRRRNLRAGWIGHTLVGTAEIVSELAAPCQLTAPFELA